MIADNRAMNPARSREWTPREKRFVEWAPLGAWRGGANRSIKLKQTRRHRCRAAPEHSAQQPSNLSRTGSAIRTPSACRSVRHDSLNDADRAAWPLSRMKWRSAGRLTADRHLVRLSMRSAVQRNVEPGSLALLARTIEPDPLHSAQPVAFHVPNCVIPVTHLLHALRLVRHRNVGYSGEVLLSQIHVVQ